MRQFEVISFLNCVLNVNEVRTPPDLLGSVSGQLGPYEVAANRACECDRPLPSFG